MRECLRKICEFVLNIVEGMRNRYPPCCVLSFSVDAFRGISSSAMRGVIFNPKSGFFIPCRMHSKLTHPLSRFEIRQLEDENLANYLLAPSDSVQIYVNGNLLFAVSIPNGIDAVLGYKVILSEKK